MAFGEYISGAAEASHGRFAQRWVTKTMKTEKREAVVDEMTAAYCEKGYTREQAQTIIHAIAPCEEYFCGEWGLTGLWHTIIAQLAPSTVHPLHSNAASDSMSRWLGARKNNRDCMS